jgi:hypothetical protein
MILRRGYGFLSFSYSMGLYECQLPGLYSSIGAGEADGGVGVSPQPHPLPPNQQARAQIYKRLSSPGIDSARLCSLAGRYDNPIPTRFPAPIDCSKIPAQALTITRTCTVHTHWRRGLTQTGVEIPTYTQR